MTTPDPVPGSAPVPENATSPFDPATGAGAGESPVETGSATDLPWPAAEGAPWPPVQAPPAAELAPPPAPPPAASTPPFPGAVPPAGSTPSSWDWQPGQPAVQPARRPTPAGLVAGVILVIVGAGLLVSRVVDLSYGGVTWPLWVVLPGVAMLVGSFFIPPRGGLGLAIPGAIVTMVGLVLWVQEAYGLYATWAYAWALVAPTAPGLGMLLYGLVHRDGELVGDGLRTTLVGIGLFLGFALFFEGVIGLSGEPIADLDQVLPYAIIGLGALLVVLSFFGNGRRRRDRRRGV